MKKVLVCLAVLLFIVSAHAFAAEYTYTISHAQSMLRNHSERAGCGIKSRECRKEGEFKDANTILALSCVNDNRRIKFVLLAPSQNVSGVYRFERGPRNGVNTRFSVKSPEGCTVLAMRRAVHKPDGGFHEVVYTPYSKDIDSVEMREKGMKYLTRVVSSAQNSLRNKGIMSHAFPGRLVADTVPTWVAVRLALIEHIDPARADKESIEQLMNEVTVIIAANAENAYRYSVSAANARGLFQFTPSTYDLLLENYVSAELITDFISGTQDHLNAAQAALLLFDLDTKTLSKQKRSDLSQNRVSQMEYLAASYNGGSGHAKKAMRYDGTIVVGLLLLETQGYIINLRRVHQNLRFGNPSL